LAHQLAENFGALDRATLALPEKLGPILRALKPFGVWFGQRTVYLPRLLRPDAAGLLSLLWGIWTKQPQLIGPPSPGLTSFANAGEPRAFLQAAGFALIGERAIRFDMLERLEDELERSLATGTDAETVLTKLVSLLGSGKDEAREVLAAMGWRMVEVADAKPVWRRAKEKREPRRHDRPKKPEPPPDPNSPFAASRCCARDDRSPAGQVAVPCPLLSHPAAGPGRSQRRQSAVERSAGGQARPCHQARRCADAVLPS
jgi:ATP-dependent RNA helicase SUPV3L1/SUV3